MIAGVWIKIRRTRGVIEIRSRVDAAHYEAPRINRVFTAAALTGARMADHKCPLALNSTRVFIIIVRVPLFNEHRPCNYKNGFVHDINVPESSKHSPAYNRSFWNHYGERSRS